MLPREEEPQIKVPMIDVMVAMPGATPKEVEQRVTIPMEKLLYEVPGIEYIYSTSMPGQSLLIARFYVGENMEDAIVRLNQKLATNFDRIPKGVSPPAGQAAYHRRRADPGPDLAQRRITTITPCGGWRPRSTMPSRASTRWRKPS